jgi:hypothetical protein
MRRGVALAIALVAILTVSAFVVVPASVRAAPTHTSPGARPAATDTIQTTNNGGGGVSSYNVGLSTGNVYFYATDPVDTTATVAINDYNATRDGLTNPVATTTAHIAGTVNWSYLSNTYLKIPLTLIYPGTWNITISGTSAGFAFQNFSVHTYYVTYLDNSSLLLPGHSTPVSYYLLSWVNQVSLYQHITKVSVTGYYSRAGGTSTLPGTPTTVGTGATGTFNINLPTNASLLGTVWITFWANTSGWSEQSSLYLYVAQLSAPVIKLSSCAGTCYTNTFQSGAPIVATVTEWLQWQPDVAVHTAAPGATLNILYEAGASVVHPAGSPPTTLTTNANGQAQWLFTADPVAFSTTGPNALNVTSADPTIPSNKGNSSASNFFVEKSSTAAPRIEITFGEAQYYGGDTIFANWTMTGNSTVTQGWNATLWYAQMYSNSGYAGLLGQGVTNGSAGMLTLTAPLGFTGTVYLWIYAANATQYIYDESGIGVSAPQILLSSNEPYYQAGDMVTFTVTTLGSILSSANLQSIVSDSFGARLSSGALTGTTISVTIPKVAPPTYIEVTVFAVATTGATITNATLYVDLASGFDLSVGVATKSNYVDGSFQPGQTIQFSYAVTVRGYYTMPKAWTIWVWPSNAWENTGLGAEEFQTTASSGMVSYTIPSNSPNGIQTFYIEAQPTSGGYDATNTVAVNVQSNPSGLGLELGAGSGLTLGWLILLIIIVVIAIVLFLAIRSHGRPKMMKPESGSPPTGPSTQAWQESSPPPSSGSPPSGGGPPTPPSGSS